MHSATARRTALFRANEPRRKENPAGETYYLLQQPPKSWIYALIQKDMQPKRPQGIILPKRSRRSRRGIIQSLSHKNVVTYPSSLRGPAVWVPQARARSLKTKLLQTKLLHTRTSSPMRSGPREPVLLQKDDFDSNALLFLGDAQKLTSSASLLVSKK